MDQLLIALDVETSDEAVRLADALRGVAGGYKIGNRLFTAEGPSLVRRLTDRGDRVFLDLKFHDIPNTVATAVEAAAALGVWMVNVHASGGVRMMQAARDAAQTGAARLCRPAPLVVAVTVLTSMNGSALADMGISRSLDDQVAALAALAKRAGLDGVVASAREIGAIRRECGRDFVIVTPGIRGGGAARPGGDDQERTMSPAEAMQAGASYLVVGRPIIAAPEPRAAAEAISAEMRSAPVL
jgi:orotidine-5'-phosphate decarboxylase